MSADGHDAHGDHGEIHLPPNSWVPITLSLCLAYTFVGFLLSPFVWGSGLIFTIATLTQWARAARNEYRDLPD